MKPREVYDVLKNIGVTNLHHANTVTTSCTFLEHGALLSRGYVERHDLKQTPQGSDDLDKRFRIWDDVFLDHVNIHHRGGRRKGPNQYGPVLFVLELAILLQLPSGTDVRVTRMNPIRWTANQKDEDRWFLASSDLSGNVSFGDFDKMLVIRTPDGKIDFPDRKVKIMLDDPKRPLSSGVDAYGHAEQRLLKAAQQGRVVATIASHQCQPECQCVQKYASYGSTYFDSRFA